MEIKIVIDPDRQTTQSVLYFQFQFMDWSSEEMVDQDDRFGSLPFGYVIGYEDKQIVGTINLLKRKVKLFNQAVLLGGFGGVCTHSSWRRRGVASRLIQTGMGILKDQGCDIAYLSTDLKKLKALYSGVGFVPLGRQYRATGLSGKVYLDDGGMIAPINSPAIFKKVLSDKAVFDLQGQDW